MRKKGAALRAVEESPSIGSGRTEEAERPAAPDRPTKLLTSFTPVPRKYRYDGWTPERQRAFIGALAETGCVSRAAALVNMAQANCYTLRRAPGAEEFRRAWDAALDFGLKRLKDVAFERAMEGYLVPVFVAGKLMGFRRKYNDALLMFCLRHYGQDQSGRRVTVNYFSTRSSAGAAAGSEGAPPPLPEGAVPLPRKAGGGLASAETSATTVRTVITGGGGSDGAERLDDAAAAVNGFEGVALDAEAQAAIAAALEACAERARAAEAALDEGGEAAVDATLALGAEFVRVAENGHPYRGTLEAPVAHEDFVPFAPGEERWQLAGADTPEALVRFEEEVEALGRGRGC